LSETLFDNIGMTKEDFKAAVDKEVRVLFRKKLEHATPEMLYQAVGCVIEEVVINKWMNCLQAYEEQKPKTVYYLSMEVLIGRLMGNNLINLGAYDDVKEALDEMGIDLNLLEDQERDPALGNGGLGRLAACFLDSLASLGYAAYGCGIRYHYGMFKQKITDGFQEDGPANWLKNSYPFELKRPALAKEIRFGGNTRIEFDPVLQKNRYMYENYSSVRAIPYDIPVIGYKNEVIDTLRIVEDDQNDGNHRNSEDVGAQKLTQDITVKRTKSWE